MKNLLCGRALGYAALTLALAISLPAAQTIGNSNVQIGGFFSQGYIQSSGNNYPVDAKDGTGDFREMAVNLSTTVGSHLRLGAQGFAQSIGNYGGDEVLLDWAVADYNFRQEFGVRAGRVKLPKGLYGEALDLDAVRPFVFLPMSLYNPVLRDFSSAFNGGMVYGSVELGHAGSLDYKAFYGSIPMNTDQGVADFFNTTGIYAQPGVAEIGMDHVAGFHLVWSTPVSGLKGGVSYSTFSDLSAKGPLAALPAVSAELTTQSYHYWTWFAEYATGDWTFAGEYQQVGGDFRIINPFSTSNVTSEVKNWYVAVSRRFAGKFEGGAYYSVQENSNPTAGSPSAANHNRDWTVSLRYDINEHLLVKIEHHWIDGRYNVFNTVRTPNPAIKDDCSFFAVKTTLSF